MLLFGTIWVALALFVAGELGKPAAGSHAPAPRWAWPLWTAGLVFAAVHIPIALADRYAWSHAAAVAETARQTSRVFGLDWGGGIYVNYLFMLVWAAESWWWGTRPNAYRARSPRLTNLLRTFYFIVIVNAAVVFARPAARIAGLVLVAALMWVWRPRLQRSAA